MSTTQRNCPFCAIIAGDQPGHIVSADDSTVAFLDNRPLFKGHVLVTPVAHLETLADFSHARVATFFGRVKSLASAVEHGVPADGTFVALNDKVSQSVPHLHVHVVPRRHGDGLRGFFWPRTSYDCDDEAAQYATRIRDAS